MSNLGDNLSSKVVLSKLEIGISIAAIMLAVAILGLFFAVSKLSSDIKNLSIKGEKKVELIVQRDIEPIKKHLAEAYKENQASFSKTAKELAKEKNKTKQLEDELSKITAKKQKVPRR